MLWFKFTSVTWIAKVIITQVNRVTWVKDNINEGFNKFVVDKSEYFHEGSSWVCGG